MSKYTVVAFADRAGTGRSTELEAATPWLALERSHSRFGWRSAVLLRGKRMLARVNHLPLQKDGVWQILPPR